MECKRNVCLIKQKQTDNVQTQTNNNSKKTRESFEFVIICIGDFDRLHHNQSNDMCSSKIANEIKCKELFNLHKNGKETSLQRCSVDIVCTLRRRILLNMMSANIIQCYFDKTSEAFIHTIDIISVQFFFFCV